MDDLISRQDAIGLEYIVKNINGVDYVMLSEVQMKLRKMPSAQPEQQWIPCSERLPDLWDERYLVSLAWGGVGAMEYKSTGFHNYGSFSPVPIETVTAWMPLPEPLEV